MQVSTLWFFDKLKILVKGAVQLPSHGPETVTYKGKALIAKRRFRLSNLVQFDLMDTRAALEDMVAELLGWKVEIQLVSVDLDQPNKEASSGIDSSIRTIPLKMPRPKLSHVSTVEGWIDFKVLGSETKEKGNKLVTHEYEYSISFEVPKEFGEIGAFVIKNYHRNEFFLKDLHLRGPNGKEILFKTLAWIHPHKRYTKDRVFFSSKTYLPSETPAGLVALRKQELEETQGDGTGKREPWDRIYDYDVYNDLGQTQILGGSEEYPYPRRIRTGRHMSKEDPNLESRLFSSIEIPYIPSDEFFLRTKNSAFIAGALKGFVHRILPAIEDSWHPEKFFESVDEIKELYKCGLPIKISDLCLNNLIPEHNGKKGSLVWYSNMFHPHPEDEDTSILKYPKPSVFEYNEKAWETDEEYGRQALAGQNPSIIRLLKKYPPTSTLFPSEEFPNEKGTSLTDEHILPYLGGQTVAQAIESKKLFTIDYHDIILPFVEQANSEETGFKSYAPRTIFFLSEGQMKPVAIELSLPPTSKDGKCSHRVFTPADEHHHLWTLAKIHASCIDSSYHQIISHFTYTHATVEPFIIASNRQLSKLHPIRTLLQPHFKDTLAINAGAREVLICAGGLIEKAFNLGKCSMLLGSKGYGAFWRFDTMGIPGDLLSRGMAEPADESYKGSVKLVVEDYPYAKDGLDLWDDLYKWAEKYCNIAYNKLDKAVTEDKEIQAWWNEIINVGHGDHKNAPWWPKLDSIKSLAHIVTSIAWIAGPFHASVNFGQYSYSGYPLNKPTATRKFIPEIPLKNSNEEPKDDPYTQLQATPEKFILSSISKVKEVTTALTVLELLSTHSPDEEYLGDSSISTDWTANPKIEAAFKEFSDNIKETEKRIDKRNNDTTLVNRSGPAKLPYTLLCPTSEEGLTGKGVPYSVSI